VQSKHIKPFIIVAEIVSNQRWSLVTRKLGIGIVGLHNGIIRIHLLSLQNIYSSNIDVVAVSHNNAAQ